MEKILFLIQHRAMPSSRVRVLNLVPELEKAGLQCTVLEYPRSLFDKLRMLVQCTRHQITYLQKKIPTPVETGLVKLFSRKLVFDFDDAIFCNHEVHGGMKSRGREIKSRTVLKLANAVVAGNRILKEYADTLNRKVFVLPSCVEVRGLPLHNHRVPEGPVVVGWVGGSINLSHLMLLAPVLQRLAKKRRIELCVVCDKTLEIPGVAIRPIPWSLEGQDSAIAGFDIGVMPLPNSRHAQGKCGYKAIQCMAAGVPVVVSDVGINRDLVEHGVDGFFVGSPDEFEPYLLQLIDDAPLRANMGARARDKIENRYSVEQAGKQLAEILRTL